MDFLSLWIPPQYTFSSWILILLLIYNTGEWACVPGVGTSGKNGENSGELGAPASFCQGFLKGLGHQMDWAIIDM